MDFTAVIKPLVDTLVREALQSTFASLAAGLTATPPAKVAKAKSAKPAPAKRKRKTITVSTARVNGPVEIPAGCTRIVTDMPDSNGGGTHVDVMTVQRYVEQHPGQRSEQIKAGLGVEGGVVNRLLKSLVKAGSARTEGQKRATSYYPVTAGA